MSTLSGILQTGKQALLVEQLAMQVIGHNTANVNTEGFSRQRVDFGTAPGMSGSGAWRTGTGVDINHLGRIRDGLLDQQIRNNSGTVGYWGQRDEAMGKIEEIYSELGGSAITDQLQQFWSAWQDLANNPENQSARIALHDKAKSLAGSIRDTYNTLDERRTEIDQEIGVKVGEANQLTSEIARLNTQIVSLELNGTEASDLRDTRDRAIDRLSKIMKIRVSETANGSVNVFTGGQIIVQNEHATELKLAPVRDSGYAKSTILYGSSDLKLDMEGGEIKSLIDIRDKDLEDAMSDLNTFALTLADEVNQVHRTGYGLSGSAGFDFFESNMTTAADFQVSAMIEDDVSRIATAGSSESPGDNSIALQIASLQHQKVMDNGQTTLDDFYTNASLRVSAKKSNAVRELEIEKNTADHLENRRQQISGVSMDEEMTRLIQVQQAYEAAAKIIQTVDEMMQTVLSLKGAV